MGARLARLSRERGEDFQLVLTRYANERLLFRLASSRHAQRFVLKGAALFTLWTGKPHRATRDLDLLGFGDPGVNSRMKDFYDIAVLGRDFDFDGELLARAIRATFERRKTALPTTTPVALTAAFSEDTAKKTQWSGFGRKAGVRDAGTLAETIAVVREFVGAPLATAASGTPAPGTWRAGGAWG